MLRVVAVVLFVALLAGCQAISTRKPIGAEPVPVAADLWAGTWYNPDVSISVRIVDEAAGRMEAAFIEEQDGALKPRLCDLELRKTGDLTLLNFRAEEGREKGTWNWCRVDNDGGKSLALWIPRSDTFEELEEAGTLNADPAAKSEHELLFDDIPAEIMAQMSDGGAKWWVWEHPLVFFRLARP